MNAADYFNNLNGIKKDVLRRNDWGYNFGGPIVRDKLFFFWSQEWNRELRGGARSANVPTEAERQGDFSQLRLASDGSPCENAPVDALDQALARTFPRTRTTQILSPTASSALPISTIILVIQERERPM